MTFTKTLPTLLGLSLAFLSFVPGRAQETRLLRHPDISTDHIVFAYANDLWVASRDGQEVRRLTSFTGTEASPRFSPDGTMVAFSGQYDGNTDVYVVPVLGGEPRRLTWHPGPDVVKGWSADGKSVIFASGRANAPYQVPDQFWEVTLDGKLPQRMPIPRVAEGMVSPDGKRFAYQMIFPWESEFRNYRGGQNNPIRISDLATMETEKLPWDGANDNHPVWVGDQIFFLSDRNFTMNVWSYDLKNKTLQQRTYFSAFDCKNLEAGAGQLIFENEGYLYTLDASGGEPRKLSITVRGDFAWARPHWEKVSDDITSVQLSPTGKRALFTARGEVFTVPADKGDIRNLTNSSGAADRAAAWSADGAHIAWFSDQSGEYQLFIADQYGKNLRKIDLEDPTFYYDLVWSPDSKHLSYTDSDRNIWVMEVASGDATKVDNEGFAHPIRTIYPEWAPDSRWLAYTKRLTNEYNAIFLYSLDQKKTFQLTDGMSDCQMPAWDKGGKFLYFSASTNYGLNVGWLDMSSIERPQNRAIYLAVLSADEPSPLEPKSDDEEIKKEAEKEESKKDEEKEKVKVKVDLAGIQHRIIALDVPERPYQQLKAGEEGMLFFSESVPNQEGVTLQKYSLKDREASEIMKGVQQFALSADGKKMLYGQAGNNWTIVDAGAKPNGGNGKLNLSDLQMELDPAAEWKQIFREAWRFQRDYFYVENVHGLDLDWAYQAYAPLVEFVRHRSDLTYLLDILGGETAIGHSFTGGGDLPDIDRVPVGLLGADFEIANGRYRINKIYTGESWNPELRAPLAGPGINVKEGDFILAVNGVPLDGNINIYSLLDRTAGKQTILTLNSTPDTEGSREQKVVPVSNEAQLRQLDWIESNRRRVDELSGGKLAYVWLPNTGEGGYAAFNRYYFAQKNKKGAVIDERFNQGGYIADYIVDLMARDLMGYFNNPIGDKQPWTAPNAAIWGPKVMLINEMAGSGGDMLPFMFRAKNIGPLVGKRTWGGLVGIWDVPSLIDGGYITAPRGGFYNVEGEWDVENKGVAPDVEVEQDPKLVSQGHDPQLEKAVEVALDLLKTQEVKLLPQPADPVRVKRPKP